MSNFAQIAGDLSANVSPIATLQSVGMYPGKASPTSFVINELRDAVAYTFIDRPKGATTDETLRAVRIAFTADTTQCSR